MMTKSMYVVLALIILGSPITLSAQNRENRVNKQRRTPEQVMQMQSNQMLKTLQLDEATAAKFTPVYTRYLEALRACRVANQKANPRTATKPELTDAEVEKQIKNQFAQSRKIVDVREKYYKEFRKILSPKQIAKIYQAERGHATKVNKEYNRRKHPNARPGNKRPTQAADRI